MRRMVPWIAVAVALLVAGVATFALGGSARRPSAVPPLSTPRLRALWGPDRAPARPAADDDTAPEDETPTLNVLTTGGLPEEPGRHDFELGMDKIRQRVMACHAVEQFVGMVLVQVVIDRSGSVKTAQVLPPLTESQTGQCVAKEVRHAVFPRFRGTLTPTVELTYPFYFRPADN